jgi:hypothetical protein
MHRSKVAQAHVAQQILQMLLVQILPVVLVCRGAHFLCTICAPLWEEREKNDTYRPPPRPAYVQPTLPARLQPPPTPHVIVRSESALLAERERRKQLADEEAAARDRQRREEREDALKNINRLPLDQQVKLLIG